MSTRDGHPLNPPRAWTARLRDPIGSHLQPGLDPIELTAIDSAVPFAAEHARRYIATGGEDDGWEGPRPILLLYTVGRRTGIVRRNPLLYFEHGAERYVVGSKGGSNDHPLWFENLVAEPSVHIRVGAMFSPARAVVLDATERAEVWRHLVAEHQMFGDYQRHTTREIPLVRLITPGTTGV